MSADRCSGSVTFRAAAVIHLVVVAAADLRPRATYRCDLTPLGWVVVY